ALISRLVCARGNHQHDEVIPNETRPNLLIDSGGGSPPGKVADKAGSRLKALLSNRIAIAINPLFFLLGKICGNYVEERRRNGGGPGVAKASLALAERRKICSCLRGPIQSGEV